jgi:competence protein ComEC
LQHRAIVRVPAALVALPLFTGACAGILSFDSAPDRFILAAAFAAVLCVIAGVAFGGQDQPAAVAVCVVVGAMFAGGSTAAATVRGLLAPPLLTWFDEEVGERGDPVVLEGRLRVDAPLLAYGAQLTLDVELAGGVGAELVGRSGGVRLVVGGLPDPRMVEGWRAGRRMRVTAVLRYPATFSDPGVPDERRQLALRGIVLTGSVKSGALVEMVAIGRPFEELAASTRARIRRVIARHVGAIDARSAAVATAILIGDRTGLSSDDERRLQDAGTYHVIAISGGNIASLTAILVLGTRLLRVPHRAAASLSIIALLFYAEVAGGTPSVDRAVTAAVVFLAALVLDHRGSPLNVLAVAGSLAIGAEPVTSLDGGFLLSFGATAAIIVGVPRLVRWTPVRGDRFAWQVVRAIATAAAGIAAATFCAEMILVPVSASLFSRVTFAGLLLNFIAIPLMTIVQCASMALVAAAWSSAADALARLVHLSASALVDSASLVDLVPWTVRDVPPPALWICVGYYAGCLLLAGAQRFRRPAMILVAAAGATIASGAGLARDDVPPQPEGVLRVVVLDVGQGDATVAVMPNGRALLIDSGGLAGTSFDIGARVVMPALRALRVRELHALVLTHGDPDHVGGTADVLQRLRVANVWEGVPVPPHPLLRDLAALANSRQVVWRTVRPGDVERIAGVDVRVHHPPEPEWERQRVRNDDSVVLELRYGNVSILLPGDIEREGERRLLDHLALAPLVVLKAPHHGSATSSSDAFLDAVRPSAVIFSAGRNNRFGHPAQVVVDRFAARHVAMFNTADDGAVFVETDGKRVEVQTWRTKKTMIAFARHDDATTR